MTNFCQVCGGQRGLHFSTLPGCTCVNPTPINYVINQQIKREWQGLTDEEVKNIVREAAKGSATKRDGSTSHRIAKAIEANLKEKNHG